MVKHTETIHRPLPKNCFKVFDHIVGLALKRLNYNFVTKSLRLNEIFLIPLREAIWKMHALPENSFPEVALSPGLIWDII